MKYIIHKLRSVISHLLKQQQKQQQQQQQQQQRLVIGWPNFSESYLMFTINPS